MNTTLTIRIHSTAAAAQAILAVGEQVITASWKQTSAQQRKERAVILQMESLKAPEVPEAFRALVESCLLASAEQTLKDFVNAQPNSFEMLPELFSRPQLVESFLSKSDSWMSKEDFELAFTASATWKRITGRAEFASNVTYQAAANGYKEALLKITGKTAFIPKEQRDQILAKLESDDLNSEFGSFVLRRFDQMGKKDQANTVSFADL